MSRGIRAFVLNLDQWQVTLDETRCLCTVVRNVAEQLLEFGRVSVEHECTDEVVAASDLLRSNGFRHISVQANDVQILSASLRDDWREHANVSLHELGKVDRSNVATLTIRLDEQVLDLR